MRVALVAHSVGPRCAGLARATTEIAISLELAGHEVCIFVADQLSVDPESHPYTEVGFGLPVKGSRGMLRRMPVVGAVFTAYAARRAVLALHMERPFDVIEAWNWKFLGLFLALAPIAPFVTRNATSMFDMQLKQVSSVKDFFEHLGIRLLFTIERISARTSTLLISNSIAHRKRIQELYNLEALKKLHVSIPLSLPPIVAERSLQFRPPPETETLNLLFVGRASRRKGFDALVSAICKLDSAASSGEIPDFHLRAVGVENSELIDHLKRVAGNLTAQSTPSRLECLGRVEDAELYSLYHSSHIVLAPSRYESFGFVYWEAMAFGRPVVACAEDPCAIDSVGKTRAGLLALHCDGEDVKASIEQLLCDQELRLRLGKNGCAAARKLSRRQLAESTIDAYKLAIQKVDAGHTN